MANVWIVCIGLYGCIAGGDGGWLSRNNWGMFYTVPVFVIRRRSWIQNKSI